MSDFASMYPIAVDLGDRDVYVTQLKKSGNSVAVASLAQRPLPDLGDDREAAAVALAETLRDAVASGRFRGRRAALHLPLPTVSSVPLHFTLAAEESVDDAIVREAANSLPYPLDEALVDYPSLASPPAGKPGPCQALLTAARRDEVDYYLAIARRAGLVADIVDFGPSALLRLHGGLFPSSTDLVILGYVGRAQTMLTVATGDRIVAHRNVDWGLQALVLRLVDNLDLPPAGDKARFLLGEYGLGRGIEGVAADDDDMSRAIHQIVAPGVEEFIAQLGNLTGYVRTEVQGTALAGVFLYGQAPLVAHLDTYVAERINMPVQLVNPMTTLAMADGLALSDPGVGAPFALALGLALRKVPWL